MPALRSFSLPELQALLHERGQPRFRGSQLAEWLYEKRATQFGDMANLPAALRQELEREFTLALPEVVRKTGSRDTTQKFLFRLRDGQMVESVLIPASPALYGDPSDRRTICISSQVGCAYGCKFCASGLDGWKRNLQADEIVDQLLAVEKFSGEKVNNIVFMGMGEPMANYDNLLKAIHIINAPWGVGLGARHITISTSGLVPQIKKLAEQPLQVRLAISLHGATDEVRGHIMPVNRKYPLAELLEACDYYRQLKKQRITFEFILIAGVNDTDEQAVALGRLTRRLAAKVNVIPYNTVEGLAWNRPSEARQDHFMKLLTETGATATIRREKGHDIAAACGQLRLKTEREISFAATPSLE